MKIVIFIDSCAPFDVHSAQNEKLGATEKAVIMLADAWQRQGHNLRVLTPAPNPPPSIPLYLPHQALPQIGPVDLLIVVREWRAFFLEWKAKKKAFLALDKLSDFSTFGIADKRALAKFDYLLSLDADNVDSFCELSGFPKKRVKALKSQAESWDTRALELINLLN